MSKQELVEKIENMIEDKNYYINSGKGNKMQIECWKYAREDLQNVLRYTKLLDD